MLPENAEKSLKRAMSDKTRRGRPAGKESAEAAAIAKELGSDVTAAAPDEALKAFRKIAAEEPKELTVDEVNRAAGGALWTGEDAPDGHEMGCILTCRTKGRQIDNNNWRKAEWICNATNRAPGRERDAKYFQKRIRRRVFRPGRAGRKRPVRRYIRDRFQDCLSSKGAKHDGA